MGIPIKYRKSSEAVIASYNYTDLAEGTGIVIYNGLATNESTGINYVLTSSTPYSNPIETTVNYPGAGEGSASKKLDLDFDLSPFNLPKTLKGTAIITATLALTQGTYTASEGYFIFKIRKWNGVAETEIASVQTATLSVGAADTEEVLVADVVVPQTHFKKGEILRLTVEGWSKMTNGDGKTTMGHDPKDRDGTYITPTTDSTTTKLEFHAPFRIDL